MSGKLISRYRRNAKREMSSITRMLWLTPAVTRCTPRTRDQFEDRVGLNTSPVCFTVLPTSLSTLPKVHTRLAGTYGTQSASCQLLMWITFFTTINHTHIHTQRLRAIRSYKHYQCVPRMCSGSGNVKGRDRGNRRGKNIAAKFLFAWKVTFRKQLMQTWKSITTVPFNYTIK